MKVTFKQTVNNNDYQTFSLYLPLYLDLKTREGRIVQKVHLHIWATAKHELAAISTQAQSFATLLCYL